MNAGMETQGEVVMRGDSQLINIRFNDGKVKRLARSEADELVNEKKANFLSNTLYKAVVHGVAVKPGMTDLEIKDKIQKVLHSEREKREAEVKKKLETKQESSDEDEETERQPQKRRRRGKRDHRDRNRN